MNSDFVKGECRMSVEYMSASPEIGVVSLASPYAVDDTTERVVRVLERGRHDDLRAHRSAGRGTGGGVDDATHDARYCSATRREARR